MFLELNEKELIPILKKNHNIIITLINYEERSKALLEKLATESVVDRAQISLCLLELTSSTYKIDVLGALKRIHRDQVNKAGFQCSPTSLEYPGLANFRQLELKVKTLINNCKKDRFNIVIDITCLPKALMYALFELIYSDTFTNELAERLDKIIVIYTTSGSYPSSRYAQVVGTPVGYFRNEGLASLLNGKDKVEAVIFPGFEGFDSAAVFEALTRNCTRLKTRLVFFIDGHNFVKVQRSMIANQLLIHLASQRRDSYIDYCFSFFDGMEMIISVADDFARQSTSSGEKLFLIAPFGPKPLTLASWIAYKRLNLFGVNAEIAHVSGFQYTSVYSIGKGNVLAFQLPSLAAIKE
jgi:hypothetical protein